MNFCASRRTDYDNDVWLIWIQPKLFYSWKQLFIFNKFNNYYQNKNSGIFHHDNGNK